jgi:hypothetical protein
VVDNHFCTWIVRLGYWRARSLAWDSCGWWDHYSSLLEEMMACESRRELVLSVTRSSLKIYIFQKCLMHQGSAFTSTVPSLLDLRVASKLDPMWYTCWVSEVRWWSIQHSLRRCHRRMLMTSWVSFFPLLRQLEILVIPLYLTRRPRLLIHHSSQELLPPTSQTLTIEVLVQHSRTKSTFVVRQQVLGSRFQVRTFYPQSLRVLVMPLIKYLLWDLHMACPQHVVGVLQALLRVESLESLFMIPNYSTPWQTPSDSGGDCDWYDLPLGWTKCLWALMSHVSRLTEN